MTTQTLNLARKWRSKTFDTMVGQELAIKMLKNSLYTDHYFPVYLLAGQRGCGKTSTARIFAAAVNCQVLPQFQKDPKNICLPCLECASCVALATGTHPDVIEIDAASHTGVDNVRMIVESSSLLPLMGRKKIYLIDEAHMLSKAAFNAFLKVLEEPPVSALFLLATTDPQKIIDTVRSRCFQLFFGPVETSELTRHLASICQAEQIVADDAALSLISKETGGSVRDAINLLERVRFIAQPITADAVYRVLGHLDDARLLQLYELVLHKSPSLLLKAMHEMKLENYSPEFLWQRWVTLLRASLWIKYNVPTPLFAEHRSHLEFLLRSVPVTRLMAMLATLYDNELLFGKTTAMYSFFEMILLRLCQTHNNNSSSTAPLQVAPSAPVEAAPVIDQEIEEENDDEDESDVPEDDAQKALWQTFITALEKIQDPLLLSVFRQGTLLSIDHEKNNLAVQFPKELSFFQSLITDSEQIYKKLLKELFAKDFSLRTEFSGESKPVAVQPVTLKIPVTIPQEQPKVVPAPKKHFAEKQSFGSRYPMKKKSEPQLPREPIVDVSDVQRWQMTNLLLKYFPGTVTEIQERV